VFREMVAPFEPVVGRHRVYAVVRSAVAGTIGSVRSVRIEWARAPIDWRGVAMRHG